MRPSTQFLARLEEWDRTFVQRVGVPIAILLLSLLPYLIPAVATRAILPRNRPLGLTLAVLSLALAGMVLWLLRIRLQRPGPAIYILALLSTLLFLGIGSFAAISTAIFTADPSSYTVVTPRLLFDASRGFASSSLVDPFGFFADYYLWHFLDVIPGIKATETLKFVAPAEPNSVWTAMPALAFRIYVFVALIASYKTWRKSRTAGAVVAGN